ncbi:ribonucleases P/MRP protein subunit POP1 [Aplysia californica]|uniref:Ribonucleases P/MRP protein subunit POP1 n=1 Tax=Aplysia californica TaxID=6500 RepID=A0ABM0K8K6_APLCA|nr:ribonucleases P/MRP protein subunit POP1 [Aplysia californica]
MQTERKRKAGDSLLVSTAEKQPKMSPGRKKELQIVKDVNVQSYIQSRAVEVRAFTELVKNVGGNHTAFQKLPRHMRRRAMSHNIKRVPRRLHEVVKAELERTKAPAKRPSRRYRRRPSNLLSEYERRKRRIGWLETHIWHAKRFKMVEKWGYRLALHPCDKSVRACYRAVNMHCMMQDVSFESYIEVKGSREDILSGLSHITSQESGPTFASKMTSAGTRQGLVTLYSFDSYPRGCIGQVTYLWKGRKIADGESEDESLLWICCHPSFYSQAMSELRKCFPVSESQDGINGCENGNDGVPASPLVRVTSLKDQLVTLRLYGPGSNTVLAEVLRPASVVPAQSEGSAGTTGKVESERNNPAMWWKEYYSSEATRGDLDRQIEVWSRLKLCRSPAESPPHSVIAVTVRDPRVLLPPKRQKVASSNTGSVCAQLPSELFSPEVSSSPLWDVSVRQTVKSSKMAEKELNKLKGQQLIPGSELDLGDEESRIPVLLIQRPGIPSSPSLSSSSQAGYASGWDVVIPGGWAMAFWVAFVYRGARVGGLREAQSVWLQAGQLSAPGDFPDSRAGLSEINAELGDLKTRHERRPPAKRPNYTKLGMLFPFEYKAGELVKIWTAKVVENLPGVVLNSQYVLDGNNDNGVVVLRERKLLCLLDSVLANPSRFLKYGLTSMSKNNNKNNNKNCEQNESGNIYSQLSRYAAGKRLLDNFLSALVPVSFHMLLRGVPYFRGHVCLPSDDDLRTLDGDKSYGGPVENLHKDPGRSVRKAERKERLKLRRKKQKGRKTNAGSSVKGEETSGSHSSAFVVQSLDLLNRTAQETLKTQEVQSAPQQHEEKLDVLTQTGRPIIGFVRKGDFDLGRGQGSGVAFCSVAALLELVEQQKARTRSLVLVRNPSSLQFRFASLSIAM